MSTQKPPLWQVIAQAYAIYRTGRPLPPPPPRDQRKKGKGVRPSQRKAPA